VGKTALINEFIKDKDVVFFTGIESSVRQNLENFSKSILLYVDEALENIVFPSFQAALEYVFKLAETKRLILVMDEYSYVAKASESLASTLQFLIDKNKENSKLFLILCGSSMSFMENHVLTYKAPLYGRITAQSKILPFDFFESRSCFKEFSITDMAAVYGAGSALFCECKWTNEKIDAGVLNTLVERSRLFNYENVQFCIFAKTGFTKACAKKAVELGNTALVTFEEIAGA
jgi:AAA+ ATPase superfamily predicted ATPase